VRLAVLVGVVAAFALGASAAAAVYPARPGDRALLVRPATANERLAEAVALRLTGKRIEVRCTTASEAPGVLGLTPFVDGNPSGYFLLMPAACRELAVFRQNPRRFDPSRCTDSPCIERVAVVAQALQAVAHESYHALGYRAEATAECYGMQSLWYVARRLGASTREGESLADWYWRYRYPAWRASPHPQYWSPQCHDGGALDLRPRSHDWPS
jgi:hypothetical protein